MSIVPPPAELDRSRVPGAGVLRPFHLPPVERRSLSNGLQLLVCEVRNFPVVTFDLVLPAGGLADPAGKGGVASLTSGLLDSGAGNRTAGELAEAVDALGLSLDSGVSWDIAQVGFTCLRSRLPAGCEILGDLVLRPTFPVAEVERLRDERLAALKQRRGEPGGVANEVANLYFFAPEVPFSRPLGGTAASAASLGIEDVRAFHAQQYRPGGSTLIAAGDIGVDEAVELAERVFAGWEGSPPPLHPVAVEPRVRETTVVLVDRPGAVQSEVRVGHIGIERTHPDYFAAIVLNAILGGMFSSRLNMNLRERLGYTYGASSGFGFRRLPGTFSISTAVGSESTAHSVSEILRELREMQESPVSAAELDDARAYLAGVFPLALQTTDGVASKLATIAAYGLPDDYYDRYRDRILAVSAEDVLRVAREHLRPESVVVVIAGDADRLEGELAALSVGPLRRIDPAEELV